MECGLRRRHLAKLLSIESDRRRVLPGPSHCRSGFMPHATGGLAAKGRVKRFWNLRSIAA